MASRARVTAELPAPAATRAGVIDLPPSRPPAGVAPAISSPEEVAKRHEVLGLVTLAAALLLALALASYDARGGRDWCGPIGARAAESLVAFLGTAGVMVPWSLAVLAVRLFRRAVRPLRPLRALGTAAIIATIATALHLSFGERPMLGHLPPGGLVGVTLGELLRALVGTAGAHLVTLTALLVALVVRTRLSVVAVASSAREAGIKTSVAAKDGIVTVARAWRQAREEDLRARAVAEEAAAPRIVGPEARTEAALAPMFATAQEAMFGCDDDEAVSATDSQPDATRAGLAALLGEQEISATPARPRRSRAPVPPASAAEEPAAATPAEPPASADPPRRRARKPRANSAAPAAEGEAPLAVEAVLVAARAPAREPEVRAEAAIEAEPEPAEEPEAETAPEALPIVSHDEEIRAAMRTATGAGVSTEPAGRATTSGASAPAARPIELPKTTLLAPAKDVAPIDEAYLRAAGDRLVKTLKDYTIDGRVVEIHPGPVVTTFEFMPAAGTKLSKIARLSDDIAMSLEANRVRIVAPIPGKNRVGFEIPNARRQTVYLRELLETEAFQSLGGALPVAFGKDVVGAPFFADLATMPHLIVAGATGAGKSVGLNVMLTSLLYKRGPEDVRLLMIDPKMVELAVYDGIPHMLLPVVTDMKKASLALRWVVDEMERRYTLFAQAGARTIITYNERVTRALAEGKTIKGLAGPVRAKETGTTMEVLDEAVEGDSAPAEPPKPTKLPYILVVVDEFADLMMVAGKEVEAAVARLAQKARAAGIHVILATQRPSVDVITGVIKANFPSRVAFKVSQRVDSRTILDQQGAEHLLGRGDMLILPPGASELRRVHCAFVSEEEVQAVTDHWRNQGTPTYDEDILRPRDEDEEGGNDEPDIKVPMDKYEKAVALVLSSRRCSVSWVQRQLAVGYNVAARMVEKMERDGIVGPPKGPGKDREVLG
jgi:S-DNA-T family DNA segregation ATPase FtsK/SpoIIIE